MIPIHYVVMLIVHILENRYAQMIGVVVGQRGEKI